MFNALREILSSKKIFYVSMLLTAIVYTVMGYIIKGIDTVVLVKLQTTLSPDVFKDIVTTWQKAGLLDNFKMHFIPDFFYLILYPVMLGSFIARYLDRNSVTGFSWLVAVPFLAGFFDAVENVLHLYLISDMSNVADNMVAMSGSAGILKWALVGLSFAVVLILLIKMTVTAFRK